MPPILHERSPFNWKSHVYERCSIFSHGLLVTAYTNSFLQTRGSSESNFFTALGTLNAFLDIRQKRRNVKPVQSGIETCKTFLEAIVREVYVAINQNHVLPNVSFLLVNMSQVRPDYLMRFFIGTRFSGP
jgi:hypothetical protein